MKTGTYPSLRVADDYATQRLADPDMRVRDIGRAIVKVLPIHEELPLDSEIYREALGRALLGELEAAGYRVEFHRLAGTHR